MRESLRFLCIGACLALFPFVVSAQLSGNYTINPSGSGTSNYTSITAALTALSSSGVNGPVVFTISSGTYNEDIRFTSNPSGISATNTITFRGVGKHKVTIKDSYPLYLSSTDYIRVEDVTLDGSTYGLYMSSSDYCNVTNCIIKASTTSSSSSFRGAYVYRCNYDTIRDCRIVGGYYGLYVYGTGTSYGSNEHNGFYDNDIVQSYYYAIYNYYSNDVTFDGNYMDSMRNAFTYGLRNYRCTKTTFTRNQRIFRSTNYGYGFYTYNENQYGTSTNRSLFANNYVGGKPSSYMYGMYHSTTGNRTDYFHNTFVADGSSSSTRPFFLSSGTGNKIKNNIFQQNYSSGYYAVYIGSANYVDSMDYNNYYSASSNFVYLAGARTSLTALKAYSSSYNQNSLDGNISFPSDTDPLAIPASLNNKAQGYMVSVDIEGNSRPTGTDTKLDIGCNDYFLPPNDAGISGFPAASFCAGTATAQAFIKNYGTNSLGGCTVNWAISIDGGSFSTQSSKTFGGTTPSGGDTLFTLGTFSMAAGKTYTIKAWTTSPNSSSDGDNSNDTSYVTMAPAMAGTFTVGGTGADFSSIGTAVQAMDANGICGPVTLRLANTTFSEQVIIPDISGTSSTNTIRIVGGGADQTIISHGGTNSSAFSTVIIDGTDYVTLDSMTIEATGSSYGATVWFTNQADYNTVSNCNLLGDINSLTSIRLNVVFSSTKNSMYSTGNNGNHNSIVNNRIRGGYMGIAHYASTSSTPSTFNSGDRIENNHISRNGYGLYFRGVQDKHIIGNVIDSMDYYAMYNYYALRDSIVQNEFIGNPSYNYSVYMWYSNFTGSSTSDSTYFINNMVSGGSTYGAYFWYNYRTLFLNNSFSSSAGRTVYFYYPYYSQFKNNSFENTGTGYAVYYNSTLNIANGALSNNNYYAPNASNLAYYGGDRADLSAWIVANATQNTGSISADPQHNSSSDLRTLSPVLNNKGVALVQVPEDFEGDTRPAAPDLIPDIGADEYYLPPYDLDIISVTPSVFGKGNNTITVTVRNTGINAITGDTAYVSFARGSETPTKDSIFITSLAIGAETTFTFNNTLNVVADTSFNFCVAIDGGIVGDPDATDEWCQNVCVGASGTYSIDKTGNGDFKDFDEAISSLTGCGVSGKVTFEVEPGTYSEQVVIPEIGGASATNRIEFVNAGNGDVVITNTGNSTSNWITVLLDGADYVTFDGITIEAKGTSYGAAVMLTNDADYNRITNCNLYASTTATFATYVVPVVMSSSTTSVFGYGTNGDYNVFEGNLIRGGGYYGIRLNGPSSSQNYGNDIINNEFYQQYYYPIYTYYVGDNKIVGNTVDSVRNTSSGYGIYCNYSINDSIANNTVNAPYYGIYHNRTNFYGSTTDTSYVVHNMIVGGSYSTSIGYYGYFSDRVYLVGNSIYNGGTSTSNSYGAMRLYYCDDNKVRNNNVYRANNGYALVYFYGLGADLDYNNWYAPNSTNPIYFSGSNYASVSAYNTGASQGASSIEVDPQFTSTTDLHTRAIALNNKGVNMPRFNLDFDGETRPLAPDLVTDIGLDEYYLPPYDADITAVGPSAMTSGSNTISATITNNGINTWSSNDTIFLEYSVEGGTTVKDTAVAGVIAPGSSMSFDFSTPYTLIGSGVNREVCITLTKQFKGSDPDTLNEEYCGNPCVRGITSMTIDAAGNGDFMSFNEAVDYLGCAGVTGPTTIRVKDGTYNESVVLSAIPGASNVNKVRFVGESLRAKLTYGYGGTSGDWTAVRLDNCSHVTFDSLTIENSDASYGWGVHFYNGSDSNTISNCVLTGSNTVTSSIYYNTRIVSSNSLTFLSNGDNGDGNTIENNRIVGGYYGIVLRGAGTTTQDEHNTISNNTFRDQYFYSLYMYYQNDVIVDGNDFDSLRSTSGYNVFCHSGNRSTIANNKIQSGYYGIYHYFMNYYGTSTSDTSYVVNNMISNFGGAAQRGIYAYYSDRTKFLHNSVETSHSSTTSSYASFYMYNSDNCVVMNNIFTNTSGGITFYQNLGTVVNGWIDYNNYYAPSSTYLAYMGGYRTTLSAWKTAYSTQNINSLNSDPGFVSTSDLHSFNDNINNKANMFHTWPTDFDGDPRPTSPDVTSDLGADDFWIPLYDADVLSIETPTIVDIGNNTVTARIQNRGLRNLTGESAVVSYTINGGSQEYDTIAFKFLPVGSDTTYVFNSPWNNTGVGTYDICVGVDTIFNRTSDSRDEICITKCAGAKDTITVDPNGGGDYTTITAAVARLSCGIAGPTVVYIKDGTYKENVTLASYAGSSTSNTVEFMGESVGGVIWDNNTAFATITLNGATNMSFENMTIKNSNTRTQAGAAILLSNQSTGIEITGCEVYLENTTNSNTAVIVSSGNVSNVYTTGYNAGNITISDNVISGGYYGVALRGLSAFSLDTTITISGNHIKDWYNTGIYTYNLRDVQINDNQVDSNTGTFGYGIYSSSLVSSRTYNNVVRTSGYSIYKAYENTYASTSDTSRVYNNVMECTIGNINTFNAYANYYSFNSVRSLCYHNTMVNTTKNTSSYSGSPVYVTGSAAGSEVKNNILYAANGGYLFYYGGSGLANDAVNNNNYYSTGGFNLYWYGVYASLSSWQSSVSTQNSNSISEDPYFIASDDFHASAWQLIEAGTPVGVIEDFDGETRSATTPDIGAYEIRKDVAVTAVLSPINDCRAPGFSDSVTVTIQNLGNTSFTPGDSLYVTYMEGATMSKDTLVVPVGVVFSSGMSTDYTFKSNLTTGTAGAHTLMVWTDYGRDEDLSNDTNHYDYFSNPIPSASFSVAEKCEYETSSFKDLSTTALGKVDSWSWDFGNGGMASSQNPDNNYNAQDTFMVRLAIATDSGCVDTTYGSAITHPKPVAGFSTADVCHHSAASFTNSSSVTYGTLSYSWDMGDNASTSTSTNPMLTYANDGSYTVDLIATSDKGCKDSATTTITVMPTPDPSFAATEECNTDATVFTNNTSISSGTFSSSWDLGDGNSSSSSDPNHTYTNAGTYTVKLIETSTNGCKDSTTNSVTVNPLPTSSFSVTNLCFGDTLNPNDNSTGSNLTYKWYLGNGATSTSTNLQYVYAQSGTYTVSQVVTTDKGCTDSTSESVSVASQPLADFTFSNDCVHNKITFTNATSVACGTVSKYYWDYGDGTKQTITSLTHPQHQYSAAGTYTVSLVIELANATTDTATKSVTVYGQPSADFTNTAACEGNVMQFTDATTALSGTTLSGFSWTFGDGGSSSLKNPTNTYSSSSSYTVNMIVTDSRNCMDTVSKTLTVSPNPSADFSITNACAYDTVKFNNSTSVSSGSIASFNWDFGNNTTGNTRHTGVVYGSSGFYTVKMVATSDKGCKDSLSKTAQAYTLPTAGFSASNVCDNESMTFSNSSSGATSYSWDFGNSSGTSNASAPAYTYGSSGNYDVTLVATNSNSCNDTFSTQVSVHSLPSAAFTASDVCDGETASFSNTSTGATSYSWSYGDGAGSSLASPSHTYGSSGSYNVSVIATTSNGCKDTATGTLNVNANPVVKISADDECIYDAVRVNNTTTGASTYAWNFGDGNTSTATSPSNTYASAGTYNVVLTATSSKSCSTKDSISVDVFAAPNAAFSTSIECAGGATDFTNTSSISSGTMSHNWDFGDNSGTSNNVSPSYTYASANTYTVELIVTSNNGCKDTTTSSALVNALPVPAFSATNTCLGTGMSFTNSSTGASTYSWDFDDGNSSTSSAPTHTYGNAGTYKVELVAKSSQGCEASTTDNVVVYTLPVANFSTGNECLGDDVDFTNLSSGAASYSWNFGDGNSSTTPSPSHGYTAANTYSVTLTATSSNSCTDQKSTSVTVYGLPSPSFTATTVCAGNATSFTNGTSGTNTYAWDFGDGSSSTQANPSKTYANDGRYDVILTATSSEGCVDADTSKVTVNEQPVASFMANTVCSGDSTDFTNTSTGSILVYGWSFGDGSSSNNAAVKHVYTSGGTYNVRLQVTTAQGCNDDETVAVDVYNTPTAMFTTADVCLSDNATFNDNNSTGNGDLISDREWLFGDDNNDFGRSASHKYDTAGIYTSSFVVTTIRGCTDTATSTIEIHPMPMVGFAGNDTCEKIGINFSNSTTISKGSIASYLWNFGDGNVTTTMAPVHAYDTLGMYTVALTAASDKGCVTSGSNDVTVHPVPTAFFANDPICDGDSTRFQNHSDVAEGNVTYDWNLGDGSVSNDEHPWHEYDTFGVYTVTVTVTSDKACASQYTMPYEVYEAPIAALPLLGSCEGAMNMIPQVVLDNVREEWSYNVYSGDGMAYDSVPESIIYATAGDYIASLAITTDNGCYDSVETTVTVLESPSLNNFSYLRLANQQMEFTPDTDDADLDYSWDFGDGNTSTDEVATHTFGSAGTFEIACTVTNADGCTDVVTRSIEVFPTGIQEQSAAMSLTAYPNPFKDWVKLDYELTKDAYVRIELIDLQGRLITTLTDGQQLKGSHFFEIDQSVLSTASGNMIVKVIADDEVMMLNLMKLR